MSTKTKSDKSYPDFNGQRAGERVELVFRLHPLVMRKALIGGLLFILFMVSPLAFYQIWNYPAVANVILKLALFTPIAVFFVWLFSWIGWYYSVYIVTSQRIMVIKQKGLFKRSVSEWQLDRILNINYEIGGLQAAIFGYGSITVQTVVGDLIIPTVHKPIEVHEQLQAIVRRDVPATNIIPNVSQLLRK